MKLVSNDNKDTDNHLEQLKKLAKVSNRCIIMSPFLSQNMKGLLSKFNENKTLKKIDLITVNKGFNQTKNNPPAMRDFIEYCKENNIEWSIRIDEDLHGKVYSFYKRNRPKGIVVTSGNFTNEGLINHHEYGLFIKSRKIQKQIISQIKSKNMQIITEVEIEEFLKKAQ